MKKTIQYDKTQGSFIMEGRNATVWAINHPNSYYEQGWVLTTPVVSVAEDGSFETLNTLYVPKRDNEETIIGVIE